MCMRIGTTMAILTTRENRFSATTALTKPPPLTLPFLETCLRVCTLCVYACIIHQPMELRTHVKQRYSVKLKTTRSTSPAVARVRDRVQLMQTMHRLHLST